MITLLGLALLGAQRARLPLFVLLLLLACFGLQDQREVIGGVFVTRIEVEHPLVGRTRRGPLGQTRIGGAEIVEGHHTLIFDEFGSCAPEPVRAILGDPTPDVILQQVDRLAGASIVDQVPGDGLPVQWRLHPG